jgi:hypothetical protein
MSNSSVQLTGTHSSLARPFELQDFPALYLMTLIAFQDVAAFPYLEGNSTSRMHPAILIASKL